MISDPNSNIFTKSMSQLWHNASQLWHCVTIVTRLEILVLYIISTFILLFYICKNVIFIHRITSLFLRPWQIPPLAPVSRRGGIFMMNVHWSRTSEDQVEKFEIVEWLIETAHWKVLKLGGHQSSENSPLPSPVSVPVNWLHNHSQDNHHTTVLKYYKSVKYWGNRMKLKWYWSKNSLVLTKTILWVLTEEEDRTQPSHSSSSWLLLCWIMLQSLITPTAHRSPLHCLHSAVPHLTIRRRPLLGLSPG